MEVNRKYQTLMLPKWIIQQIAGLQEFKLGERAKQAQKKGTFWFVFFFFSFFPSLSACCYVVSRTVTHFWELVKIMGDPSSLWFTGPLDEWKLQSFMEFLSPGCVCMMELCSYHLVCVLFSDSSWSSLHSLEANSLLPWWTRPHCQKGGGHGWCLHHETKQV